jgi:hypothetical protein
MVEHLPVLGGDAHDRANSRMFSHLADYGRKLYPFGAGPENYQYLFHRSDDPIRERIGRRT